MKILYHFRTRGTGAEAVHIAGIANAFAELGHSVIFSSPSGIDPRKTAGTNPYKTQGRKSWFKRALAHCPGLLFECLEIAYNGVAYFRNAKICREASIDLIYERHAFFLSSTAMLARRKGLPLIVEVNELAGDERVRAQPVFGALARWCDRRTFRQAARIVVVSPHLKRKIEAMGIPPEKIMVLPNAVSNSWCIPADGASAVRTKYEAKGKVVIGFVGWFVPWHRLDLLLEAFIQLAQNRPDLLLWLVGDGLLKDALQVQASEAGVESRVIFTGAVGHEAMADHIAAMDIAVVPHSNAYRSPIKLFEYMAQGRAVLAPRTEPIASVIQHAVNGLLFEPGSKASLLEVLNPLIKDPALREHLGKNANQSVIKNHTWRRNAEATLANLISYNHPERS